MEVAFFYFLINIQKKEDLTGKVKKTIQISILLSQCLIFELVPSIYLYRQLQDFLDTFL